MANLETLVRSIRNEKTCNLHFKTHRRDAWKEAFYRHYGERVKQRTIQDALQLCIRDSEDPEKKYLTVNLYRTGTVMVQGSHTVLTTFENETFHLLREMVNMEEQL
ncbi:hypothetical protein Q8A67_000053 [Cirrhinus molitorella]|uniref:Uncharacterized protein n=1 Tax=Cirrhinus molitorella TaxID=172907 RepID=A0AA88QMT9_9TELE|nr:hypothetical protein Q8A67_000053 [Cirrhinus molitorella]